MSKNLRDLLDMQDGPCSETTIMKEHIRLLEERVKELVSQNCKLVQRLTSAEESKVQAEMVKEEQAHNKLQWRESEQLHGLIQSPEQILSSQH